MHSVGLGLLYCRTVTNWRHGLQCASRETTTRLINMFAVPIIEIAQAAIQPPAKIDVHKPLSHQPITRMVRKSVQLRETGEYGFGGIGRLAGQYQQAEKGKRGNSSVTVASMS